MAVALVGFAGAIMKQRPFFYLAGMAVFSLWFNTTLPLHFDEAYYWLWSEHIAASYFDHPPLIAWLLWLLRPFGHTEWVLRLAPAFCMTSCGFLLYRLAGRAFGEAVAQRTLVLFLLLPLTQLGFLLAVPDAPLALGWVLLMTAGYEAAFGVRWRRSMLLAGAAAGVALLAKYTAVLAIISLLLFFLLSPVRGRLFSFPFLGATGLATLLFSPVIYWNHLHDWSSFRFQLSHGMASEKAFRLDYLTDFLVGQLFVGGILVTLALAYLAIRYWRQHLKQPRLLFFWCFSIIPIAFFLQAAAFKRGEANWAAPAFLSACVLTAYWSIQLGWRRWYKTAIATGFFLLIVVKLPECLPFLPEQAMPKQTFFGYKEAIMRLPQAHPEPWLADSYKTASLLVYYGGRPDVDVLGDERVAMFDYWRTEQTLPERALFVSSRDRLSVLKGYYETVTPLPRASDARFGFDERVFLLYLCENPVRRR